MLINLSIVNLIRQKALIISTYKSQLINDQTKIMFGLFFIKVFGLFLTFLLNIILVRTLGLDEYGKYYYLLSIINFLSIIALFGLENTCLKYLTKYFIKKDFHEFYIFYKKSERFVILSSLLVVTLFILLACLFFENKTTNLYVILIFSVLIPLQSLTNIYFSVLRSIGKLYTYLSLSLIIRPTLLIFVILITNNFLDHKIYLIDYVYVNIAIYIAIIIVTKYYIKSLLPKKNINENYNIKSNWLIVPFYIFSIQSVKLLNHPIDNAMINYFEGPKEVSLLSIATNISNIVGFALTSINVFLAPKISNLYQKSNTKELQKILTFVAKINLIFGVMITLVIIFFGKMVLNLYGNEMTASYPLILILMVGQLFHVFCGSVTYLMIMTKLEKIAAKIMIGSALINIIMNIIFIPSYGLIGCAIATSVSIIIYNFLSSIVIIKTLKLNPTIFAFFRNEK